MSEFDIVIATRDRLESLLILINQIYQSSVLPTNIVIVDSSENNNNHLFIDSPLIKYFHFDRQNKLRQQYFGYKQCTSPILVFIDDDMRITNFDCFNFILKNYENDEDLSGVQPNFIYKNSFFEQKLPKSKFRENQFLKKFSSLFKIIFLRKILAQGKVSYSGLKANKPISDGYIEWFYGPIFSAKRNQIFKKLNFKALEVFDTDFAYGEDFLIGMTLSTHGNIRYLSESYFLHEDSNRSFFTEDIKAYAKRVAYSRLFLGFEYSRLNSKNFFSAYLHYNVSFFGLILDLILNQFLSYSKSRSDLFSGYLLGYLNAIKDRKKLKEFIDEEGFQQ